MICLHHFKSPVEIARIWKRPWNWTTGHHCRTETSASILSSVSQPPHIKSNCSLNIRNDQRIYWGWHIVEVALDGLYHLLETKPVHLCAFKVSLPALSRNRSSATKMSDSSVVYPTSRYNSNDTAYTVDMLGAACFTC